MKKKYFAFSLFLLVILNAFAQDQFTVQIEPLIISNAPNVHSFSLGKTTDGKWVIIGGRIDGLHQRQPFAAFQENDNNKSVYVIDPVANQTWSTSINVLSTSLFEQLQSTNQEFVQRGNTLYIIGGYGYSATQNDHITYDKLTAIDVDGLANAVINNTSISTYFRQITNTNLAVTGGHLELLNDVFYLCGGQYFEGRYNPQGPNHGPGFIQNYTDEIRTFEIKNAGRFCYIEPSGKFFAYFFSRVNLSGVKAELSMAIASILASITPTGPLPSLRARPKLVLRCAFAGTLASPLSSPSMYNLTAPVAS